MKMLLVVKVGDRDRPATPEDIEEVHQAMKKLTEEGKKINEDLLVLVSHHAITFEQYQLPDNLQNVLVESTYQETKGE